MKITRKQLINIILEQSDLPSDTYKVSSDVRHKTKTASKKGKLRSKQSMDTERSSKGQQTNVRTGEKRTMTNIVGDFNKTKKIGNLTTGNKTVNYYIDAAESEGADKDYFFYHMYIGKESKLKKSDIKLSMTNHPNSKKPGKITYQVGKQGNFKPASALKAILKLKLMGVKPKELIDILKNLNPNVDIGELQTAMKQAVNHKGEDYMNMKETKITRKQLRKLINEAMVKPYIPNIPSVDALGKIDTMARSADLQADADSIAGAFGYPEDRSYSADLRGYDDVGRLGAEIHKMRQLGNDFADSFSHDDPFDIGAGEGHYFRRNALRRANEICDSFDMSVVRALIDAFTEGANDYQRANAARTGRKPRLYTSVDMAKTIHSKYKALYEND